MLSTTLHDSQANRVSHVAHAGWTEHFLCAESLDDLARFLDANEATLISAECFGSRLLSAPASIAPAAVALGRGDGNYGGLHAHAISGTKPTMIHDGGRVVGAWLEDATARYCWLGDVRPGNTRASREDQTTATLAAIERLLQPLGMDFRNVFRTWFYLDEILEWYGPFNRVRNDFFRDRNIFGGIMPASTGVGAANPSGAAVLARAAALKAKTGGVTVKRVDSPLQCSAYDYGSAFSRAVEVSDGRQRRLYVSGTASIEPGGKTIHQGDTRKQMELTVDVASAILKQAGMDWADAVHAIGYFREPAEIALWSEFARQRRLPALPIVLTQCDVCRDDLLFEIELMANVAVVN